MLLFKVRVQKVVIATTFFLSIGVGYAAFAYAAQINIPCVLRWMTGIKCPGCGMTHAVLSFIDGNFKQALSYNLFLPVILFYVLVTYIYCAVQYVKKGEYRLTCGRDCFDILFLIMMSFWSVARNFLGI